MQRTYYEVLGVPADASADDIRRRFRELARQYHPDVQRDKEFGHRAFVQISEAYHVLGDIASVIDSGGNKTIYARNLDGDVVGVADALGNTTTITRDVNRRVSQVTGPSGEARLVRTRAFSLLLLADGRVAVGAVTPARLQVAVAKGI